MDNNMEPQNDYEDRLRWAKIQPFLKRKKYTLPENFMGLDFGCGSGRVWKEIDTSKWNLYGVDINKNYCLYAKSTGKYIEVCSNINFVPGIFDVVFILGVLEHLEEPFELLKTFKEEKMIYITVPNGNSFHRKMGVNLGMLPYTSAMHDGDIAIGHKRVWDYDQFKGKLDAFAYRNNMILSDCGTTSFKFTNSEEMMDFQDRWDALDETAESIGIIGQHKKYGAEIYAVLERKNVSVV